MLGEKKINQGHKFNPAPFSSVILGAHHIMTKKQIL